MDNLMTPEQVAEKLQVKRRTVISWLQHGKLQGVRVGNLWRVKPEQVEQFIKSR